MIVLVSRCRAVLRSACVFSFGATSHSIFCMCLVPHGHPSTFSQDGDTALMIASSKGYSTIMRKLLQAGATVNTTNMVYKWMLELGSDSCLVGPITPLPQNCLSSPPLTCFPFPLLALGGGVQGFNWTPWINLLKSRGRYVCKACSCKLWQGSKERPGLCSAQKQKAVQRIKLLWEYLLIIENDGQNTIFHTSCGFRGSLGYFLPPYNTEPPSVQGCYRPGDRVSRWSNTLFGQLIAINENL